MKNACVRPRFMCLNPYIAVWVGIVIVFVLLLCGNARADVFRQKYAAANILSPFFRNYDGTAMLCDYKGRIWIGTLNGLFVSNGSTVERLPLADANDRIISSLLYADKYIYVGTNRGINRVHIDSMKAQVVRVTDQHGTTIHNYCMVVRIDERQHLLFYTGYNSGAYYETHLPTGKTRFLFNLSDGYRAMRTDRNGVINILWAVETTGLLEHTIVNGAMTLHRYFTGNDGHPALAIREAVYDGKDTLWCATDKGLVAIDIHSHGYRQYTFPEYGVYELSDVKLAGNSVFCAAKNAGIIMIDRQSKQKILINHHPDDPYSILSNNVSKLYVFEDKMLMAATDKGISVIPLDRAMQFAYEPVKKASLYMLQSGEKTWLAGIGNSVYKIKNQSFECADSLMLPLNEYAVTATALPDDGWLVVTNTGVLHWDKKTARQLLPDNGRAVMCEHIVRQNDSVYFLSGQSGIYRWKRGTGSLIRMYHTDKEPYQWFNTVLPVGDSVLLGNAYLSFIKAYTIHGDSLRSFRVFNTFSNTNDWIVSDNQNVLLAGTNGISYLNINSDSIKIRDADFHEQVYKIIIRATDTLLVGEKAIYRLKNNKVYLKPDAFSSLLNISSRDKVLADANYVWSVNGTDLFRIPLLANISKLYFYLYTFCNGRMNEEHVSLSAKSGNIAVQVHSVLYLPYARYKVLYNLSGVDQGWHELDGEHIRYTQLQPGTYTLTIKAVAGSQILSQRQMSVKVIPAWYQTTLAYIVFVLLLAAAIALLFKWRINNIRKKAGEALILQQKLNELENKALRSQMNPHFLFNTLNSINHYILSNDMQEASHYLTRFSKLVRLVLDNSRKEWITLAREMEALNIYLELEMMRRNNEFDYSISIDKQVDAGGFLVPPLILQPFVENAIWHGLSTIVKDGFIEIRVTSAGEDSICITIEDNGAGYVPENNNKRGHDSFGMSGTHDRLVLMHPDNNYTIVPVYDDAGMLSGTKVSVYIYND